MNASQPVSPKRKWFLVFLLLAILISMSIYWMGKRNAQHTLIAYSKTLPFIEQGLETKNEGGLGNARITLKSLKTNNEVEISGFYRGLTFLEDAFSRILIEGLRTKIDSPALIHKAIRGELSPLVSNQHYAESIEIKNSIVELDQIPLEIIYQSSNNQAELIAQNRLTHIYIKHKTLKDQQQFNLNVEFVKFSNILIEILNAYHWPDSYKIVSWENVYIDALLEGNKDSNKRNWAYLGLFKNIKIQWGENLFQIDELSFGLNGLAGKNYSFYLIAHSCKWDDPQYQSSLFDWEYNVALNKGKHTGIFKLSPLSLHNKDLNYDLYIENLHLNEDIDGGGFRHLSASEPVNLIISEDKHQPAKGSGSIRIDEKGLHIKQFYQTEGILPQSFKANASH